MCRLSIQKLRKSKNGLHVQNFVLIFHNQTEQSHEYIKKIVDLNSNKRRKMLYFFLCFHFSLRFFIFYFCCRDWIKFIFIWSWFSVLVFFVLCAVSPFNMNLCWNKMNWFFKWLFLGETLNLDEWLDVCGGFWSLNLISDFCGTRKRD